MTWSGLQPDTEKGLVTDMASLRGEEDECRVENSHSPAVATLVALPTDHTVPLSKGEHDRERLNRQGKDSKSGGEESKEARLAGTQQSSDRQGDLSPPPLAAGVQVRDICPDQPAGGLGQPNLPDDKRQERLWEQLHLDLAHLAPLEQAQLRDHILSFSDVFVVHPTELRSTDLTQHCIKMGDRPPIKQPPIRIPFALRQTVDELVGSMLSQGVVVPSASPWASPIAVVRKKTEARGSAWTTASSTTSRNSTSFRSLVLMRLLTW